MGLFSNATSNITWDGKYVESLGEVIIEAAFSKPSLSEFHMLANGIKAKEKIGYLGRYTKLFQTDAGCGTGQLDKVLPNSEKEWDPEKLKMWVQQCEDDIDQTFFVWTTKNGIDRKNLDGTHFMEFLMDVLPDGLLEDILRMAWMGDKDIVAGNLTNGATDVPFYNQVNGLWKQVLALPEARRFPITENAQSTTAAQLALAADASLQIFRNLVNKSDSRLKNAPNTVIIATRTIMQNYADYLESQNIDNSFNRIESGFNTLSYRGIPIIEFELLDRYIQSDFLISGAYDKPHRAVFTTRNNLAIGSDDISKWDDFKIFFDDVTELLNIKGGLKMDTKIIEDHMIQVAH